MKPLVFSTPRELSNMILRALGERKIQAIGFVVEEKIDDDPSEFIVLQDWIDKGHLLGNNTYSYVDLNELGYKDFLQHVRDGQKYIRRVSRVVRRNYRYLRFPQLHGGDTKSKKKDVWSRLDRAGYVIVPATVIPSDYEFNWVYRDISEADQLAALDRLQALYLEHIGGVLEYSEKQSELVFGRQIRQILRLHLGIATANFIRPLLNMLQERGYQFVPLDEALADPAFQEPPDYVGPLGLTFIDQVAAVQGLPFDPDHAHISRRTIKRVLERTSQGVPE